MQINGIAQQLLAPLTDRFSSSGSDSSTAAKATDTSASDFFSTGGSEFHEILSHYDVTNITPREFTALIQQLHDSGEITDADFRQLTRIRLELDQRGVQPDDRMNLVEFFESKLKDCRDHLDAVKAQATPDEAKKLNEKSYTAEAQSQLDWINKFALVHASGADGVDVGA